MLNIGYRPAFLRSLIPAANLYTRLNNLRDILEHAARFVIIATLS